MADLFVVVMIMRNKTLLIANIKSHKGTMTGIFIIMLMVSLTLISVLEIWLNTSSYLNEEMERMHYGNLGVWTQDVSNPQQLSTELRELEDVDTVAWQQLIYSDYEIHGVDSDSEGQLIVYQPQQFPYRIFNEAMTDYQEDVGISSGEIYISSSLISTYHAKVGDEISFMIGRQGNLKTFRIKGIFEDPFMGSSMIGMKSFLISREDHDEILKMIDQAGMDALARSGQLFHITRNKESTLNNAQFNQLLNEETTLGQYTAFMHSKDTMIGFMLILQNVFTGLFLAFALILVLISIVIVGYSIATILDQDRKNMGILITIGYQAKQLRRNIKTQYLMVIMAGALLGMLLSVFAVPMISQLMVSFAGILTPAKSHGVLWILILVITFVMFYLFIHVKTRSMKTIPPMMILQEETQDRDCNIMGIQKSHLILRISIRQFMSGKRRYLSVGISALMLVFFASMITRMNVWLGPDGKGMMDAFNPADLDIGVQLLGQHDPKEMETTLQEFSEITDSYALAMPSVVMDGVDVTANVITEPQRFHIRQGAVNDAPNEIVITETIATDRALSVGDQVTISSHGRSDIYTISGIYQCANDMGENIGMNREGYLRIAEEDPNMWCYHYFLKQPQQKQKIMDTLNATYGGDVYIHENTWPGLLSIITSMHLLFIVMYVVSALFILIVTILSGSRIYQSEKRNLAIYKTMGFTSRQLRATFAIRYGLTALCGSIMGILLSSILTDRLVGTLMKWYGIADFASHPDIPDIMIPGIIVCLLFTIFAYFISNKIKKLDMTELITE